MSAGRMPKCPASASQGFSSTPLKITQEKDLHTSRDLDDGVLSDDEDTFSLLSPIYHDSFDSAEEDLPHSPVQQTSPRQSENSGFSVSPVRCELRKTPSHQVSSADVHPASPTLSAWEMWLVNKAKEDRLKLEKKAEEERLLKQKREQQEREQMQKKIIVDEKIQEWLKMKNEQEKHKQFVKQSKEEELIQKQREKQREIEQKAQQKYNDWLQKKNREKIEKEKKIKEEAVLKQEQEKERHKRAEEKFKDWLTKANEKSRASPKSPCYPTSPYDKSYPSPSFYNPIPWKPIQIPPPETSVNKTSGKKPRKQRTSQQNPNTAFRLRNTVSAGHLLQRR
ncbi:coiled-coil domain-containing protein 34 [Anabas testudineus]|uniref:coiled-coil domain-containing protein 34 n=1 Tax=Anabas testudineus TaxID=64144 RepID=UPI000E45CC66|nr:coiled-coil domain-containing protein 34 [Anabas testudineus]XP_026221450.1 coiled-coil domain-containing protein 34 [Anabas testudineus]XP_026221451.1 coiled-coil domain-containing protein 34 [Anabas testudineus]